jgi:hypothetical protein
MKYGKVTLGQVEAVINKLGGEEKLDSLLAGKLKVVPVDKAGKMAKTSRPKLLVRDGSYSAVTLNERHVPGLFYRDRGGLCVFPDFLGNVVSAAMSTEAGKKFKKVLCFKLATDATGEQLKSERPDSVWTATYFCAWLAAKLQKQPNGERGELLNTGWANLFLVEGINGGVFVVGVVWGSGGREWVVSTGRLGYAWNAGRRFASRN